MPTKNNKIKLTIIIISSILMLGIFFVYSKTIQADETENPSNTDPASYEGGNNTPETSTPVYIEAPTDDDPFQTNIGDLPIEEVTLKENVEQYIDAVFESHEHPTPYSQEFLDQNKITSVDTTSLTGQQMIEMANKLEQGENSLVNNTALKSIQDAAAGGNQFAKDLLSHLNILNGTTGAGIGALIGTLPSGLSGQTNSGGSSSSLQAPTIENKSKFSSIEDFLKKLIPILTTFAAALFMIMLLYGGIMYMTSMGNEEASGKAKNTLTLAVIGIIIVAMAFTIEAYVYNGITSIFK